MKLIKKTDAKKKDARPQIRIKAAGNVFVEVYKDSKGYFYRIDVPGATDFVSKERFENQDKARLAGVTHAKKFIGKVKGDQKKKDDNPRDAIIEKLAKAWGGLMDAKVILRKLEDDKQRAFASECEKMANRIDEMMKVLNRGGVSLY